MTGAKSFIIGDQTSIQQYGEGRKQYKNAMDCYYLARHNKGRTVCKIVDGDDNPLSCGTEKRSSDNGGYIDLSAESVAMESLGENPCLKKGTLYLARINGEGIFETSFETHHARELKELGLECICIITGRPPERPLVMTIEEFLK
ncbi:MAG: hypothetical protein GOU97_03980 [Nanoarchaeota archaeon]|nr:hypothetical protein [Nanoarchaeota archaeon]